MMSNGARIGNAMTYRLRVQTSRPPLTKVGSRTRTNAPILGSPRKWLCSRNCSWHRDQRTNNGPTARNPKVRVADGSRAGGQTANDKTSAGRRLWYFADVITIRAVDQVCGARIRGEFT